MCRRQNIAFGGFLGSVDVVNGFDIENTSRILEIVISYRWFGSDFIRVVSSLDVS